jgi:hypothetical protein
MTAASPPDIVPFSGRPPEDDLDGLLRAYFRAEMPDPWPSFQAPVSRNGVVPMRRPEKRRFTLWRSRLALAASILLLIAGAFMLFGGASKVSDGTTAPAKPIDLIGSKPDDLPPGPVIDVDKKGASIRVDMPFGDFPMK